MTTAVAITIGESTPPDPVGRAVTPSSLADELATYRSAADLHDLEAALDRYPDSETAEIRSILVDRTVGG